MSGILFTIVLVAIIAAIFLNRFFYRRAKYRERMILIEKGMDPNEFDRDEQKESSYSFPWLKMGLVVSGLSTGFAIIGIFIVGPIDEELFRGFSIVAIIGYSLGLPLIGNHFLARKE
jgi:hypothetical protein